MNSFKEIIKKTRACHEESENMSWYEVHLTMQLTSQVSVPTRPQPAPSSQVERHAPRTLTSLNASANSLNLISSRREIARYFPR